ncbi:MAG: M15 family metallopeptidase [Actinobacteria bacterium]|nr:M15 family metallopeptidase [Actinomycetota bacterium]
MSRWIIWGLVALLAVTGLATVGALSSADREVPRGTASPAPPTSEEPRPSGSVEDGAVGPRQADRGGVLVVWARGDLTRAFADAVASLPHVVATAHVRSDTLALVGARNPDGVPTTRLSDGFQIPVDVAAVDPTEYVATQRGEPGDLLDRLAPRGVLLSETGARLRATGVGGEVDLAGLPGLEVVAVVPDGSVGRAEIVLHAADATAAGLGADGTVFLRHEAAPGVELEALTAQIEALVPPDLTARIVDATGGELRRAPLVLSLAQVKDRFGEFAFRPRAGVREIDIDPDFAAQRIVRADVPILASVTCHAEIVDDLRGALQQVVDAGLAHEIDPARYGGCYHPRRISTTGARLSHHSWGIAIDINVDLSHSDLGPSPHPDVIAAFEAHGFRWGGDFIQPDNHHFEWIGAAATAEVDRG